MEASTGVRKLIPPSAPASPAETCPLAPNSTCCRIVPERPGPKEASRYQFRSNFMRDRILAVPTALASFAMLLITGHIALADAIDGDWCHADGKRMKIRGPEIVTPGGNQTRGDYTRHSFSYVVPAGEAGAGESVSIILLSEYLAHARQGSESAPIQVWNRCPPGVAETRPARAVDNSA